MTIDVGFFTCFHFVDVLSLRLIRQNDDFSIININLYKQVTSIYQPVGCVPTAICDPLHEKGLLHAKVDLEKSCPKVGRVI